MVFVEIPKSVEPVFQEFIKRWYSDIISKIYQKRRKRKLLSY